MYKCNCRLYGRRGLPFTEIDGIAYRDEQGKRNEELDGFGQPKRVAHPGVVLSEQDSKRRRRCRKQRRVPQVVQQKIRDHQNLQFLAAAKISNSCF